MSSDMFGVYCSGTEDPNVMFSRRARSSALTIEFVALSIDSLYPIARRRPRGGLVVLMVSETEANAEVDARTTSSRVVVVDKGDCRRG